MLKVENLHKQYTSSKGTPGGGAFGVSFELAKGELFTLLGPSGCGKTTTLRSIAGLEDPDSGRITLDDKDVFNSVTGAGTIVDTHDRDMGMVFQSYAIWPHMTAAQNVAFPLEVTRKNRMSRTAIADRVRQILRTVGMEEFYDRPATQLSGGQQQRLALARALAREPKLLLLDEPLSNLDAKLRDQMRVELLRLQKDTGLTSIYVTHDQTEALALSDRVAVMNEGKIVQLGTPKEIYNRPTSEFVANFIGKTNLMSGKSTDQAAANSMSKVSSPIGDLVAFFTVDVPAGKNLSIIIRPEYIRLYPAADKDVGKGGSDNMLKGRIVHETYLGETVEYSVLVQDKVHIMVRGVPNDALAPGDDVTVHFPPSQTVALLH